MIIDYCQDVETKGLIGIILSPHEENPDETSVLFDIYTALRNREIHPHCEGNSTLVFKTGKRIFLSLHLSANHFVEIRKWLSISKPLIITRIEKPFGVVIATKPIISEANANRTRAGA